MTGRGEPTQVLITGATGFVGRRTARALLDAGSRVVAAVREPGGAAALPPSVQACVVGDVTSPVDWRSALANVDAVVHLAARVHVMRDRGPDLDAAYRLANVDATLRLAEAAAATGVRRLIFVSSVKAAGERSENPLTETDAAHPEDAYGRSKLAAERALAGVSMRTGLEVVIVRPPLVYGPGVGGNFVRLLALARWSGRVPVPLGGVRNRRSLVYVDNLADALALVVRHPGAAGETFHVTDGEDISTPDLLRRLAASMGVKPRLMPVPTAVLRFMGTLAGRAAEVERLLGSLQLDVTRIRAHCGWAPPVQRDEALARTAAWYARRTA